ncbi:type II toxin-antitoxin system HipA family toxin [Comamonas sp. GB3 AK4-5]|uniref:type II toxin-antitoxin system HipA family toxin n=1 Tax=Comamonas sp. GB3 AK4-5 TaxID=3231487 RepID=UPI00351E3DE6
MQVKALEIRLATRRVGVLFQYPLAQDQTINRFVADDDFASDPEQAMLSLSYRASDPQAQAAFWRALGAAQLNGSLSVDAKRGWLLPAFFQNLLPEGPLRTRIAEMRGCEPEDHFEILAATGKDLPGDVQALPIELGRSELSRIVTQNNDALEMSVVADPLEDAISVSGVQAKLAVLKSDGRFVGRTKLTEASEVRHVIAKLPVAGQPLLPELEALSLCLAKAAGVQVVEAELAPLALLAAEHHYDLGDVDGDTQFLAVYRYDRDAPTATGRVHCEDFAQILGVQPEAKYTRDYLSIAAVMMLKPTLGEAAVHELLRRILVNDLMGNPDMHLKNMGLRYADGRTPDLPPAYDLVAYAAYGVLQSGRALQLIAPEAGKKYEHQRLTPAVVRSFCARLGIPEKPAQTALRRCAHRAFETWPALVAQAGITDKMKERMVQRLDSFKTRPL